MSNKIEGIAVPILTPINEVEEINHEQLAALTDYVTEGGVNAIFVNGTTGEFARFSQKSRQKFRFPGGNRVPGMQPGIVDAFLAVLFIV